MRIGVYGRTFVKPDQMEYVGRFFDFLKSQNVEISVHRILKEQLTNHQYTNEFKTFQTVLKPNEIDVLFSLGGDGTVLDTLRIVKDTEIPVIGVNMGRFGFLASSRQEDLKETFNKIVHGKYTIESRSVLKLTSDVRLFNGFPYGLNDFIIHKKDTSNMITVHTKLNDESLNSYWADGLILATPTGSTGYSLSCGGPIIYPGSASLVLTPIAPHNLSIRPLVISDQGQLSFEVEGRTDDFLVTIDSQSETIQKGSKLTVSKASFNFNMIRLDGHSYTKTIRNKLLYGFDKRN